MNRLYYCAGASCPGLPYRASELAHPPSCVGAAEGEAAALEPRVEDVETRSLPSGSATISADGRYRYDLTRPLVGVVPRSRVVLVCGLNPSTADATKDDQTIRQLRFFAAREGGELLVVVNLYAFRSTDPAVLGMLHADEAIGPENDEHLRRWARSASLIVPAWGGLGKDARGRARDVLAMFKEVQGAELMCFGLTQDGFPRHPSRLAHATRLVSLGGPS